MTLARRVSRIFSSDPPLHAFWIALHTLLIKVVSRYQAWVFHAPGLHLGPGCIVRGSRFIRFGRNTYAHGHLWIEAIAGYRDQQFRPQIAIGNNVSFSEGVHITCVSSISIADNVLFGSRVFVADHNHGVYKGPIQSHPEQPPAHRQLGGGGPVQIGESVWIGDNVVIVGPVVIGRGAIIAANSVVRADVPQYTMVGGIPAKVLRRFNDDTDRWERPL